MTTNDATSEATEKRSINDPVHGPGDPASASEAFRTLVGLASSLKKTKIPGEVIARHITSAYATASWSVQRAAFDAIKARKSLAQASELKVRVRPRGRTVLGRYVIARRRGSPRPYETVIESLEPLRGSCNCADFLRNGLGLCKHLFVALEDVASRRKSFETAVKRSRAESVDRHSPLVRYLPVRPLAGRAEKLERLEFSADFSARLGRRVAAIRDYLRLRQDGTLAVAAESLKSPTDRRAMAELLDAAVRSLGDSEVVDPAARAVIAAEADRWQKAAPKREVESDIAKHKKSLLVKPFNYQIEGIRRFLESGRLLLADDMGLGKTAQAVSSCHILFAAGRVKRGLIIVPAALKGQWQREWSRFTRTPIEVVEGSADARRELLSRTKRGFLIINYELLLRDLDLVRQFDADIVVLDEAQRIKNWATQTARATKMLAPRYRLILTGTPMENRFEELASLLEWLGDDALEPAWRLGPLHRSDQKVVVGLDTLRERMQSSTLRRTRPEVLSQLPSRRDTVLPVEITAEQAEAHDALNHDIAILASIAQRRPLTAKEFTRLMMLLTTQRIIANGMAQLQFDGVYPDLSESTRERDDVLADLDSPKLIEFRDLVRNFVLQQRRKIVVFSQWRRMLKLAAWSVDDLLTGASRRVVFFTGEESPKRREANIVAFHDDPNVAIFFATDAGGVGLNLQNAADVCINLDMPWNPAVLEQRIGRIWRLGQKNPIDVLNLVTVDSIEERISRLVGDKKAVFTGLFDGKTDEIRFEQTASFAQRLQTLVKDTTGEPTAEATESEGSVGDEDRDIDLSDDEDARTSTPIVEATGDVAAIGSAISAAAEIPIAAAVATTTAASPPTSGILDGIRVSRAADGSLSLTAPPEAARVLAKAFDILADLMRASAEK